MPCKFFEQLIMLNCAMLMFFGQILVRFIQAHFSNIILFQSTMLLIEVFVVDITTKGKNGVLLDVLDSEIQQEKQTIKTGSSNLQLTQLIDPQGNPISITTQDGQNIPVVTNGNENIIQGLLPDGTLIPINLDKNLIEVSCLHYSLNLTTRI